MRWIPQLGIPLVTASNVSAYDLSDLEIFDANLTAQEMATMDAYGAKPPPHEHPLLSRSLTVGYEDEQRRAHQPPHQHPHRRRPTVGAPRPR